MFSAFKPTWMLTAIYQLTPEQLRHQGIELVLTDLDNTLIAWNNPDGTAELRQWLSAMKEAGIPVVVVSNNHDERVARAVEPFGLPYVSRALKPLAKGFKQVLKEYNVPKERMVMVGDQLLTDIRGANGAGIRTILVQPIVTTDAWNTRINRAIERRIMTYLVNRHADMKWEEKI